MSYPLRLGLAQFSMLYPLFLLAAAVPGSFPAIIEFWAHHFCFIYVEYINGCATYKQTPIKASEILIF